MRMIIMVSSENTLDDEEQRILNDAADQVVGESSAASSSQPSSQDTNWDKFMSMYQQQEQRNEWARSRRDEQLANVSVSG